MPNPDFRELLGLFNGLGVEHRLVGGYAMSAHGYPPVRNKETSGRLQDLADLEKLKSNSDATQ